jgi:hypothetical protein
MQARQQMLDYLKTLPAGIPIAIFTLASSLRIVQGPSADRSVLSAAIQGAAANSRPSPVLDTTTDQALDSTVTDAADNGTSQQAVSAMQQLEADNTAMQTDRRGRLTLQAMQQLARYCSGITNRKNLIWFSGSFLFHSTRTPPSIVLWTQREITPKRYARRATCCRRHGSRSIRWMHAACSRYPWSTPTTRSPRLRTRQEAAADPSAAGAVARPPVECQVSPETISTP